MRMARMLRAGGVGAAFKGCGGASFAIGTSHFRQGAAQGDEARQAFQKSLAIRERLAQAEPDRADYQRDLIVSYVKMSENEPAEARLWLTRALDVARSLQGRGGLAPADAWMLDELARRLAGLSGG